MLFLTQDLTKTSVKDVKIGLILKLSIINYTGNKETMKFIISEAKKIAPNLKEKSGVRYRLNSLFNTETNSRYSKYFFQRTE